MKKTTTSGLEIPKIHSIMTSQVWVCGTDDEYVYSSCIMFLLNDIRDGGNIYFGRWDYFPLDLTVPLFYRLTGGVSPVSAVASLGCYNAACGTNKCLHMSNCMCFKYG